MEFIKHHRSINAVIRAANKQGIYKPIEEWSEEEDMILHTYYPIEGEYAFIRLPNRTVYSCRSRVIRLEIGKRSSWTAEEDAILKMYYPKEGPGCFIKLQDRSPSACRNRVKTLDLRMEARPTGALWTEEEIITLKTYYPIEGSVVASRLSGRTAATIKRQARVLNIKYTGPKRHTGQKQVKCLETGIIYTSAKEAAAALNISYKMIQANASGTKKSCSGYHWEYVD